MQLNEKLYKFFSFTFFQPRVITFNRVTSRWLSFDNLKDTLHVTLIFLNNHFRMREIMTQGRELLSAVEDIIFGISRLLLNGLVFACLAT